MKKKWTPLLALPVALCALAPLAACNNSTQLEYNKKYYRENDLDEDNECQRLYYLFRKNGTGEYHYYSSGGTSIYHYTITFDYSYIDKDKDTVLCTYKSISYETDNNTQRNAPTYWSNMLLVSKDLVMPTSSTSITYYFNETYLKNHPEFAAKD